MIKSKTEIVVRYKETDQMGIVHHSNYFPWFEIGRADLFALSGMTYFQVEEEGIMRLWWRPTQITAWAHGTWISLKF